MSSVSGRSVVKAVVDADRLRHVRAITGLTRGQVARILGIKQDHLSRLERGERPIRYCYVWSLNLLCQISPTWLLTGTGPIWTYPIRLNQRDQHLLRVLTGVRNLPARIQKKRNDYNRRHRRPEE